MPGALRRLCIALAGSCVIFPLVFLWSTGLSFLRTGAAARGDVRDQGGEARDGLEREPGITGIGPPRFRQDRAVEAELGRFAQPRRGLRDRPNGARERDFAEK